VAEHAPGGAFTAAACAAVLLAALLVTTGPAGDIAGAGPAIGLSGITDATPGLLVIAPSDEAGTRAEIASTSR
jgi:hypothetical protein